MKIGAITMVYNDHWALSQWYRHYSRHLGARNLFIIAHGADPFIKVICPRANIITVPRDDLSDFDGTRAQLLNGFRNGLLATYDWVIQTDADELVCLDPDLHASFADLFASQTGGALFAMGINIAERRGDPKIPEGRAALPRRQCGIFSGHYSKAWAARTPVDFRRHGLHLGPRKLRRAPLQMPRGVYLAHLKFASRQALAVANSTRMDVARSDAPGLPGPAWRKPNLAARRFWRALDNMASKPWEEAEAIAFEQLSRDPVRDERKNVLRTRNVRFEFCTDLPKRIQEF